MSAWTWDKIGDGWLSTSGTAEQKASAVEAFNLLDDAFGQDWILSHRFTEKGEVWGGGVGLDIILMADVLTTLRPIPFSAALIEKLRHRDRAALAEAKAIHLLCSAIPNAEITLEPAVAVGARIRKPDFSIRCPGGPLTYVEVTRAQSSIEQRFIERTMAGLCWFLSEAPGHFSVEVLLRRWPAADELATFLDTLLSVVDSKPCDRELPNRLGLIRWNMHEPGHAYLENIRRRTDSLIMNYARSDEYGAREATMTVVYADGRASEFLRREARQLPKGHPGLIMIDSAEAFRAMRTWASALQIRFRPEMYTRVSAFCLFENARPTRSDPYRWRIRRQLLLNTHASMELPSRIVSSLTQQSGED
jgi:hypothetical protein